MPAQEELYRLYDATVGRTFHKLVNRSPYHDTIRLDGFDRKNKDHLFVLRIALMARDLYGDPVEVACGWLDGIIINWKIRKGFDKVKIVRPGSPNSIWLPFLVEQIKSEIKACYECDINLGRIYDTYYEGSPD